MISEKHYLFLIYVSFFLSLWVVGLGAYTRLTDAGLGCPDWPGCYGFLSVPQSLESITLANEAFPHSPVENHKAWNEMIHRYMAGILGLLIGALAFFAWRSKVRFRFLVSVLFIGVCFQAALGMWTVTMKLMPIVVMGHLLGGFSMVCLLFLLSFLERRRIKSASSLSSHLPSFKISDSLKFFSLLTLTALIIQISLGGWTSANYAASACTQFPVCGLDWVSKFDFSAFYPMSPNSDTYQYGVLNFDQRVSIHASHRLGAMIVSLLVFFLALWIRKALGNIFSFLLLALLVLQVSLGIINVLAFFPLSLALAHTLCALLLLLCVAGVTVKLFSEKNSVFNVNP